MDSSKHNDHDMDDVDADNFYIDEDVTMDDDDYIDEALALESVPEKTYTVLAEADIRKSMEDNIMELSSSLSISKSDASCLLRYFNWTVDRVHDAWFADESKVRKEVGLLLKPEVAIKDSNVICGICFESYDCDKIKSAACGHPFCVECWSHYINNKINNDGVECLRLHCPQPDCVAALNEDMVNELASEEAIRKYNNFLVRSYVEQNKRRKWCPGLNCDYAIYFAGTNENYNVHCACSHSFCFNCCEEIHSPVDCDTVKKWNLKNSSESENEEWKKAYTKPCPKCNRPIEKNEGCMHMTCSAPCRYQFCWLCLQSWSHHVTCNRYDDRTLEMKSLQQSLLRYQHYYDRWAANDRSRKIAKQDLQKVQNSHIKQIAVTHGQPETLGFLTEAWKQIIECRRVLKWTYAYAYYIPAGEHTKKQFFEYLQGQAECELERLHGYAEKELNRFLVARKAMSSEFLSFHSHLVDLTKVTKTYFKNLVSALQNGLSDVSVSAEGSSSGKGGVYS